MLSGPKYSSTDVRERERGYCKTMYASGLPVDPDWIIHPAENYSDCWVSEMRSLLQHPDHPDAFLLAKHNDITPVYNLMREMNLLIPDDISFVAFDDPPYAQHLSPPLTVFVQPIREFTRQAVRQLENMMLHRPLETFGPSRATLLERGSCMNRNPNICPKTGARK